MFRIEAGIHLEDMPEAAEQKSGAGEKNDGESDFGDDERARQARVSATESRATAAFAEIFDLFGAGGL